VYDLISQPHAIGLYKVH